MPVLSREIGQALVEALNLPRNTKSIVLTFEANDVAKAEVTYYPGKVELDSLVEVTKRFLMVEQPATATEPDWMARVDQLVEQAKAEINEMATKAKAKIFGTEINITLPGVTDAREAREAAAAMARSIARGVAGSGRYT